MVRVHAYPVVNCWYLDIDHADRFEIVANDEESGLVEIQYFTGEIEEMDMDEWFSMRVVIIAEPKDWSGPFEVDKEEFTELGDETIHPKNWSDPLDQIGE